MKRLLLLLAMLVAQPATAAVTEIHYVMGTYLRITVDRADGGEVRAAMRRCFATARDLDDRFSRFQEESELSQLNRNPANPVTVSDEMAALLGAAAKLRTETAGAFDVTAGALTQLWRSAEAWPATDALTVAQRTSGAEAIQLRAGHLLRRPGVVIDVDGIAKGWAVDRCVAQLRADGVERALLSFGESSQFALGAPNGKKGWPVTLRSLDGAAAIGELTLRDEGLSVSAVFGHERQVGDQRVGHIIDPRTGLPLTSPAMVAVVSATATAAEAFSKALLIDPSIAGRARSAGVIRGALVVGPRQTRRIGHLALVGFDTPRALPSSAEVLR